MKTAKDYFNKSADQWDKPQRVAMANNVSEAIRKNIPLSKTMTAMEFGCGTGLISMALAPEVKHVLAVDMSENMLAVLKKKIADNRVDNITPRQIDPAGGELPGERFDLIFSSMVLHHVKHVDNLLETFFKLLNPGGRLALADLDAEDGGFHGDIPDVFHLGFDRKELGQMLERKGFTDISATTAHVMKKQSATTGKPAEFPVFLITAKKDTIS
jgi:2-polyprenyl-3-methyl-5-hydroxy-6-metoxy-1,4-benzoquinol methylase